MNILDVFAIARIEGERKAQRKIARTFHLSDAEAKRIVEKLEKGYVTLIPTRARTDSGIAAAINRWFGSAEFTADDIRGWIGDGLILGKNAILVEVL